MRTTKRRRAGRLTPAYPAAAARGGRLVEHPGPKRALLVLDNCEHLLAVARPPPVWPGRASVRDDVRCPRAFTRIRGAGRSRTPPAAAWRGRARPATAPDRALHSARRAGRGRGRGGAPLARRGGLLPRQSCPHEVEQLAQLGVALGLQLGVHPLAVDEDLEPAVVAGRQLHALQPGRQPPQQLLRRPRGAWEIPSSGAVLDPDLRLPRDQPRLALACHGRSSSSASA